MSAPTETIVTAGLRPDLLGHLHPRSLRGTTLLLLLAAALVAGLAFRVAGLGAEGLSEDELNKLQAVEDYRAHGLTSANGEHPMLMKGLQTASVAAADAWNETPLAQSHPDSLRVGTEAALRFPSALFGALTALLIYLVCAELFGAEVAFVAAALWALDPVAIGFNRIAKEDTFFLFFFLLANFFWLRSQTLVEGGKARSPWPYYVATGAAYGAMVASKYMPHFIVVSLCYNYVFQGLRHRRWQIGRPRYLVILAVMGAAFILCNPTILLPDTWRAMRLFASYKMVAHDGYEFMGTVYHHRFTEWLRGVPWYFYFLFAAVKLPVATLAAFVVGLPQLFRKRTGDGRYFIIFWLFFWFIAFTFAGGKFTRYATTVWPCLLVAAALGFEFVAGEVSRLLGPRFDGRGGWYLRAGLAAALLFASAHASASSAPHYRLYLNALGGGAARAGDYFPHDEFYDSQVRDAVAEVARRARPGARVASETPGLAAFYAERAGRADLRSVSLSDPSALRELKAGDFLVVARGRRYFSNEALLNRLTQTTAPAFTVSLGQTRAADVYVVDDTILRVVADATRQ
ncbi:MAG TPA: glycosyltransferase family 39 protein [Pyrinomonadaceae bacterium]|nr:glycosyltransferase family 39 protein [Pyrinomonadaceae bacterium]